MLSGKAGVNDYSLSLDVKEESEFLVNLHWFPGWRIWIDGQEVEVEESDDYFKRKAIAVPIGQHELKMKFTNTPLREVASWATIVSFFLWCILLLIYLYKKIIKKT